MRMLVVAPIALIGLTASLGPGDGWKDLTGKPVPPVKVERWLNTDGASPTADELRGKVWLLEFFATW